MAFSFGYTPSYRRRQYYAPLDPFAPFARWYPDEEEEAYQASPLYQLMHIIDGATPARREPQKKPEWQQVLDVHQYGEDEVKVSVDGQAVIVEAKHENKDGENSDLIQMRRRLDAGSDVDLSKLKTNFWKGHLVLRAPNKQTSQDREVAVECSAEDKSKALEKHQDKTVCTSDPKDFKLSLKLGSFSPEDIKIKTNGKNVTISAEKEDKSDEHYSKVSFYRSFSLPENVDGNKLKSKFDANGELSITVDDAAAPSEGSA